MNFTPNIGPKTRIGYVVVGAVLVAAGLATPLAEPPLSFVLVIGGVLVAIEGAVGF
jgi:hypothetical protein